MVFDTNIKKFSRAVIGVVRISQPRCNNVFGDSFGGNLGICTATGSPFCRYSFGTCRDTGNYDATDKIYKFQSINQPLLLNVTPIPRPYLISVSKFQTKLDVQFNKTISARMSFTMAPDFGDNQPLEIMDHDKILPVTLVDAFETDTAGEWWRNWFARNNNYVGKKIEYLEGFDGDAESDLKSKFTGIIATAEYLDDGQIKIVATDILKRSNDVTIPNAIKSTTALTTDIDHLVSAIPVNNASDFRVLPKNFFTFADAGATLELSITDPLDSANRTRVEGSLTTGDSIQGLTWDKKNNRYLLQTTTKDLYAVDGDTFEFTLLTTIVSGNTVRDITWDNNNEILYGVEVVVDEVVSIDIDTGATTTIGSLGASPRGCAFNHINNKLVVHEPVGDTLLEVTISPFSVATAISLDNVTFRDSIAHLENEDVFVMRRASPTFAWVKIDINAGTFEDFGDGDSVGASIAAMVYRESARQYVKITDTQLSQNEDEYLELLHVDAANGELDVAATSPTDTTQARITKFGTTAIAHSLGVKVTQPAPFMKDSAVSLEATDANAINVVDSSLRMLLGWNGYAWFDVKPVRFITERDDWFPSSLVHRMMEDPIKAGKSLEQVREITQASLFVDEDGFIKFVAFKPVNQHTETLRTLSDSSGIKRKPIPKVDLNLETQVAEVQVFYAPFNPSKNSDEGEDYEFDYNRIDQAIKDPRNYDADKVRQVFSPWIYRESDARRISTRILRRFRVPPAKYKFSVDPKDYEIQTADIVEITTGDFLDVDGSQLATKFQVTLKNEAPMGGKLDFEFLDAKQTKAYGFIAHSGAADHGAATATEKFHAYIGIAEELEVAGDPLTAQKATMGDGTDGYYTW